jgi:acylphosphatase
MGNNIERAEIVVEGRVQGVFFRRETKKIAKELGLFGWVRNEDDGRVRIIVEGKRENISALVEWAKKGTIHAQVTSVKTEWREPQGSDGGFEIKF